VLPAKMLKAYNAKSKKQGPRTVLGKAVSPTRIVKREALREIKRAGVPVSNRTNSLTRGGYFGDA
ncbi:MAG: hypothetical protein AABZ07_02785, partial [Nitrospirota bacterium]